MISSKKNFPAILGFILGIIAISNFIIDPDGTYVWFIGFLAFVASIAEIHYQNNKILPTIGLVLSLVPLLYFPGLIFCQFIFYTFIH